MALAPIKLPLSAKKQLQRFLNFGVKACNYEHAHVIKAADNHQYFQLVATTLESFTSSGLNKQAELIQGLLKSNMLDVGALPQVSGDTLQINNVESQHYLKTIKVAQGLSYYLYVNKVGGNTIYENKLEASLIDNLAEIINDGSYLRDKEEQSSISDKVALKAVVGKDLNFISHNEYWEKELGYTTEDLSAIDFLCLIDDEDKERIADAIKKASFKKDRAVFCKVKTKDSQHKLYHFSLLQCHDDTRILGRPLEVQLEHLHQTNELYSSILDHQHEMICRYTTNFEIIYANRSYCNMMGYDLEELIGKSVFDFLPEEQKNTRKQRLINLLKGDKPTAKKYLVITKYGTERHQEWTDQVLYDVEGNPFFQSVGKDVTEKIVVEQQLKEKSEQFELILEGMNDGIWDLDLRTRKIYYSTQWKAQLGYEDHELKNEFDTFKDLLHPDDRDRTIKYIESYLSGKETQYEVEFRMRHKLGNYLWIKSKGASIRDENNTALRMAGSHSDITSYKEALLRANNLSNLLEQTQSMANMGAWELDIASGKTFWTDQVYDIYDLDKDYNHNKENGLSFYHPEDGKKLAAALDRCIVHQESFSLLCRFTSAKGKEKKVKVSGQAIAKDGKIQSLVGLFMDVTQEEKNLEDLIDQKEFVQQLVDNLPDGFSLVSKEGVQLEVNEEFCRMTGFTKQELIGNQLPLPYWPEEEYDTIYEVYKKGLETGNANQDYEMIFKRKSGERFPVIVSPTVLETHKPNGERVLRYFATVKDITARKKAEQELITTQQMLTQTSQVARVGGWEYNIITGKIVWTDFISEMLGLPPSHEPVLEEILSFYTPDSRKKLQSAMKTCMEYGIPYQLDLEIITSVKRKVWVRAIGNATMEGGKVVKVYGTFQDINEQKIKEEQLKNREQELNLFFNQSLSGFYFMSLDQAFFWNKKSNEENLRSFISNQRIVKCNEALARQYETTPNKLKNCGISDLFSDASSRTEAIMHELLESGSLKLLRSTHTFTGKRLFLQTNYHLLYDAEGRVTGHFGVEQDITDHIENELELHDQAQMQKLISELSSQFINVESKNFRQYVSELLDAFSSYYELDRAYVYLNDNMQETFYCNHQILKNTNSSLIKETLLRSEIPQWVRTLENGQSISINDISDEPSSEEKTWMEQQRIQSLAWLPLQVENKILGFIGGDSSSKVINWKKNQVYLLQLLANVLAGAYQKVDRDNKLKMAMKKADEANRAKSVFLANMSHELRTPLNGMIGFTNLLLKSPQNQSQKQYTQAIYNSSRSLLALINDILDLSKIEAGKISLNNEFVDLFKIIDENFDTIRFLAQEKKLKLQFEFDPQLPRLIYVDSLRISQVLLNLLNNAIKFKEKGFVKFKLSLLNNNASESTIRFSIIDSGIGIEQSKLKRIFKEFVQADSSTTKKYGGTGLGLSISNRLLKLYDTKLHVDSKLHEGSTFYFDLKVKSKKGDTTELLESLNDYKLLFSMSDDNLAVFENVCYQQKVDYNIIGANESFDTLQNYAKEYDFVFTDHLPWNDNGLVDASFSLVFPYVFLVNTDKVTSIPDSLKNKVNLRFLHLPMTPYKLNYMLKTIGEYKEDTKSQATENTRWFKRFSALLVEDNAVNMQLMNSYFMNCFPNATIYEATDGLKAIEQLQIAKPDIIITDIQMPRLNGLELIEAIRAEKWGEKLPIVALSAKMAKNDIAQANSVGANVCLSKPILQDQFFEVVLKMLNNDKVNFTQETAPTSIDLDNEFLKEILGGDPIFALEFLEKSIKLFSQTIIDLQKGFKEKKYNDISKAAHKVKGTLLYFGQTSISEMASKIETETKNSKLPSHYLKTKFLNSLLDLKNELHQIQDKLKLNQA
ncbi:MAG: PAS domain S-box protein [Cyclobacteriaceae bacterium]|nr:PAS domain S-box protein [Cyclobacteriaceae bacterium]